MGKCAAHECEEIISPERLFCLRHWKMVPKALQSAVYSTWRRFRKDPLAYAKAREEAIRAVAEKEAAHPAKNQGSFEL